MDDSETTLENLELPDYQQFLTTMLARQRKSNELWASDYRSVAKGQIGRLIKPDENQAAVIEQDADARLSVIANAGTGKTFTILRRVLELSLNEGIHPADFTLVAFNNKAAKQLHDKWFEQLGVAPNDFTPAPRCTTLHALGYLTTLSLSGPHGILAEREKRAFVLDFLHRRGLFESPKPYTDALEAIALDGIMLDPNYDQNDALEVGMKALGNLSPVEPLVLHELRLEYAKYKMSINKFDFEDLALNGGLAAANASDDAKALTRRLHKYLICDEGQDIDRPQNFLMNAVSANITLVGDPKQSLYTWRQARPEIMYEHGGKILFLTHNYRSEPNIVRFANRCHRLFPMSLRESVPFKPEGSEVPIRISSANNPDHERAVVCTRIKKKIDAGVSPNDIAILVHTNQQCSQFEAQMVKFRIPYRIKQNRLSITDSPEFMTLAAIARLERNPADTDALLVLAENTKGIGVKALEAIERNEVEKIKSAKMRDLINRTRTMADRIRLGTPEDDVEKVAYWASLIDENEDLTIDKEKLRSSVDLMFEVMRRPLDPDLAALMPNALDAIALTTPEPEDRDGRPKITIATVHSSKGLEWGHVYLPHMNLQFYHEKRHPLESACWLYVALTRAKTEMDILFATRANPSAPQPGRSPMRPRTLDIHEDFVKILDEMK